MSKLIVSIIVNYYPEKDGRSMYQRGPEWYLTLKSNRQFKLFKRELTRLLKRWPQLGD